MVRGRCTGSFANGSVVDSEVLGRSVDLLLRLRFFFLGSFLNDDGDDGEGIEGGVIVFKAGLVVGAEGSKFGSTARCDVSHVL